MKKLISIIIPVYNAEKYLNTCIDSVIDQDYDNFEIILVDDGSKDNSGKICDSYILKDSRISVIHKKNEGAGIARNFGLRKAKGDYIIFLDSDDFLEKNTLLKCIEEFEKSNVDILLFGYNKVDDFSNILFSQEPCSPNIYYSGDEIKNILLPEMICPLEKNSNYHLGFNRMCSIKKELIDSCNWSFVSEKEFCSEDLYSMLFLFLKAKKIGIIRECLYNYRYNINSITNIYDKKMFSRCLYMYESLISNVDEEKFDKIYKRIDILFLSYLIYCLKMICNSNLSLKDKFICLAEISNNSVVIDVINKNFSRISFLKKIIFYFLKNRMNIIIYIIFKLRRR